MPDLPDGAKDAYLALSQVVDGTRVIFDPPYLHQEQAIREILTGNNVMIMTGTGSGKTESFLLPILGKLAIEAKTSPRQFRDMPAMRALVLYPMNALVNDQLSRLRLMFGNQRTVTLFEKWAGRPIRFGRYTSRTPYAGLRSPNKDSNRLKSYGEFFGEIEDAAMRHASGQPMIAHEDEKANGLYSELRRRGRWPAKPSVSDWFGEPHTQWRDRSGRYTRAVMGPHDAELLTRHEAHSSPPDLLITNYSMLEYMMMRPVERPIFDRTREWLAANKKERLLIVLDEAHLYRGAQGAEVGLLLRRLRERLDVGPDRLQVICATASFSEAGRAKAGDFGAQLSGLPTASFVLVQGEYALRQPASLATQSDLQSLLAVDLTAFHSEDPTDQIASVSPVLAHRGVAPDTGKVRDALLFEALEQFEPLNLLVNLTMKSAVPVGELGKLIFGDVPDDDASRALTALATLASQARPSEGAASLLPCRVHSFFRGLPGLWICMNPNCSEVHEHERNGFSGKLYSQPVPRCACGSPVLEYYTCRHCGTSYARAYTNDVQSPTTLWSLPGQNLDTDAGLFESVAPLDLLLEEPTQDAWGIAARYDLRTGRLNDPKTSLGRTVFLSPPRLNATGQESRSQPGQFTPCGCCGQAYTFGQSSVQDHLTKGDQPFQALLNTQILVQPPGPQAATPFAPLRGRKVLVFSDSRQVAARLAPTLQSYSLNDTVRALLPAGFRMLAADPQFALSLTLDHAALAVVVAAHCFGVRLRPELDSGEVMPIIDSVPVGTAPTGADLIRLIGMPSPANLMSAILRAFDKIRGLEQLAVASIRENPRLSAKIQALPGLPGLAEEADEKLAVARSWIRCWNRPGIWFASMPPNWWGTKVISHKGSFEPMERVFVDNKEARKTFNKIWLPRLLADLARNTPDGGTQLLAANLSLEIGGAWRHCRTCKSVHRPVGQLPTCIECGSSNVSNFDPDTDDVFRARSDYYRAPIMATLAGTEGAILSLIAAEHTAQIGTAQADAAFSRAESHELRFQDIDLAWRDTDPREEAIDILSSTTTMEVGIDIGELSGVALRNMPPARANYQQRSGRAGRRGTAVATVIAFGSADSHDDHYFSAPGEMIRGPVVDPRLTLENPDIARRHLRAFLLQSYHQDRIPGIDPGVDPSLFSVLGSVSDFRMGTGTLNRADFAAWLRENEPELAEAARRWLPIELPVDKREGLIAAMIADATSAIDDAIDYSPNDDRPPPADSEEQDDDHDDELPPDDDDRIDPATDKLLDRLLYRGVLPRYAFPTDVASFYVFNRAQSTAFRPVTEFSPSQGLSAALSQYAPNKQVWIAGKQYTSKAIYSPYRNDRGEAWGKRRLYYECSHCGHAKTTEYSDARRGETITCEACKHDTFGPAKPWFRPPGFAHPIDQDPVSVPDAPNETAYATRAKLVMPTPGPEQGWQKVGERVRAFSTRRNLLVSNSGPKSEGYHYCVACGRIEPNTDFLVNLHQPHDRPYRSSEPELCPGRVSPHVVLGTDFITDIALFSLPLSAPFRVRPGMAETEAAMRTVSEALAKAASRLLEIEAGEILAEYRPALTNDGANGLEVEVFLYDTLAGGAGFSTQLADRGPALFEQALKLLEQCPENCDGSCYRCLRSFRNRLDHGVLDRQLGAQLLRHALYGGYPTYDEERQHASLALLLDDLRRQYGRDFEFEMLATSDVVEAGLKATRRSNRTESNIALASPIAPDEPTISALSSLPALIPIDDMLIRRNLARASVSVLERLR
jgi:ATP-dependent helicase YprA (DUF1998 family)